MRTVIDSSLVVKIAAILTTSDALHRWRLVKFPVRLRRFLYYAISLFQQTFHIAGQEKKIGQLAGNTKRRHKYENIFHQSFTVNRIKQVLMFYRLKGAFNHFIGKVVGIIKFRDL